MKNHSIKNWKRHLSCALAAVVLSTAIPMPVFEAGAVSTVAVAQAAVPKLNKTKLTLEKGETYKLKLKNAKNVTWKSKNKKIAKISSKGNVKAVKEGTTKVYAVYKSKKYYCKVTVTKPEDTVTADTSAGREELAKRAAKEIIKAQGIDKLDSDVAKVKAVHDYIVLNTEYDYNNYMNDTIPQVSYEAYGVLVLKTGVCDSYRKAFQIFMDILEIPCEGVSGTGNGGLHAWNVVTLDGERYHIDVTWDDPVPDEKGRVVYNYFLVNDKVMKEDHTWSSSVKACSGTKYRTYPYEAAGQKADTLEEAKELIKEQCSQSEDKKYEIQILLPKNIMTLKDIVAYVVELNPGCRGYRYSYYPEAEVGDYYFYSLVVEVS